MNSRRASLYLFLLGAFSMTQIHIVGNIGISEFVVFCIAPFVYMQDREILRYDGFITAIRLALLACCGCIIASIVNKTPFYLFLKGFASPYAVFSILVVGHRLVRYSLNGYKWFCLGLAMTWIINIFIFQRGVEADAYAYGERGLSAVGGLMSGPLFWISRVKAILNAPIKGWYLKLPVPCSILALIFMFLFSALTSVSGRSAAAGTFGSILLIIFAGRSRARMKRVSANFWVLIVIMVLAANGLSMGYKIAAQSGWLGEEAFKKYEVQMKGRKEGLLSTLMGGRMEFFSGLYTALQNPIIGYGHWAVDVNDYYFEFLSKYGTDEDMKEYLDTKKWLMQAGMDYQRNIMAHSHIIEGWLKHGIFGFLFWLYVVVQIGRYFRKDLATVPQWYGLLAVSMPTALWAIFFAPFGDRVGMTMMLVYLLMTRAIRLGRVLLPQDMVDEIKALR